MSPLENLCPSLDSTTSATPLGGRAVRPPVCGHTPALLLVPTVLPQPAVPAQPVRECGLGAEGAVHMAGTPSTPLVH